MRRADLPVGHRMCGEDPGLRIVAFVFAALLVEWMGSARLEGHQASTAYARMEVDGSTVRLRVDLALRDLDDRFDLDANRDGAITWGELRAREAEILSYVRPRLRVRSGAEDLDLRPVGLAFVDHADSGHAVLRFEATSLQAVTDVTMEYGILFEFDAQHRVLASAVDARRSGATTVTAVLDPEHRVLKIESTAGSGSGWGRFVREGVHHIWTGYDHLLFLLALLLPAVLERDAAGWRPVASLRVAFGRVVRVVTAFTAAHSVTLALAAFDVVRVPGRLVEPAIAASVVFAAVANLRRGPVAGRPLPAWLVPFAFGLIHGFGFAGALGELGLQPAALARGLVGFNAGVELGQLACVAAFLPLAYAIRRSRFYRDGMLRAGSFAIAAVAALWMAERVFDLRFMPF